MNRGETPAESPLVLIVDDQPAEVKLLEVYLSSVNYRTVSAYDGREALEKAEVQHPDVIVLDIMMPHIDGFEVCRRLKASPILRDIPIIFLSAKDRVEDKVEGLDLGAHDYLTKPFRLEELSARLRRVLQQRREHRAEVQALQQFKNKLLSTFHHELRTPLTLIRSFTDMLARQVKDLPVDQQIEYLKHIADGYESLMLLADNLLVLERLDRGEMPARHPVDILAIARSHLDSMAHLFEQKAQGVETQWPQGEETLLVLGEDTFLRQAMGALVANAYRSTPEGGLIQVTLATAGEEVRYAVKDGSPGIPEEGINTVFERFHRSETVDPEQMGGLELSLMVAQQSIQFHGGRIMVRSEAGQGNEFSFILPLLRTG